MIQEYVNENDKALETVFLFPKSESSIFHHFEAIVNNQTLVGRIKEKNRTKQEYTDNLEKGNTVAYAEIDPSTHDVMRINLGNIPPRERLIDDFTYLEELTVTLSTSSGDSLFTRR